MSNQSGFQRAFGLDDDAPMMRPPEERIEIW
jgi:predicted metalloendopeptidase